MQGNNILKTKKSWYLLITSQIGFLSGLSKMKRLNTKNLNCAEKPEIKY